MAGRVLAVAKTPKICIELTLLRAKGDAALSARDWRRSWG
jgi:hypothetical protein